MGSKEGSEVGSEMGSGVSSVAGSEMGRNRSLGAESRELGSSACR